MAEEILEPAGFETVSVAGTAVGITPPAITGAAPRKARKAIIQCETNDVRWRDDGVSPTASVGMLLKADADFFYLGKLTAIKFIRVSGTGAVNVSYYA